MGHRPPLWAEFDGRHDIRRLASYIWTLLWGAFLWGVLIFKLVSDDRYDIVRHYTSWSWAMALVFFTLDAVSYFAQSVLFRRIVYAFFFWFAWANAWIVFWVVYVILGQNPQILLDATVSGGGAYTLGQVLLGERTLHVIPVIALVIWLFLRLPELARATAHYAKYHRSSEPEYRRRFHYRLAYFLWVTLVPFLTLGIYALVFNIEDTYGVTLHLIWVFFIIAGTLLLFVTLFVQLILEYAKMLKI